MRSMFRMFSSISAESGMSLKQLESGFFISNLTFQIFFLKCILSCFSLKIHIFEKTVTHNSEKIVSNDKNNANSNTVEVVYMTTKPKTDLPTHVYIESALRPSTLLCEQISTVSEERIGEWIGELTESEVQDLDIALAVSLGMKCGPGQLDTDTLEHLNNLQAELDRTKAELREAKSGPDYKLLYDQLIEKMLSR